jgi:hypothetical protein
MVQDIPHISTAENVILTEEEVYEPVSQMELNKAPGPDEFPAEFYQKMGSNKEGFDGVIYSV